MRLFMRLLGVCVIACAAGTARAADQYFNALAAEFPPSGGCSLTRNTGSNHQYYTINCTADGQYFYIHHAVPEDVSNGNRTTTVYWQTTDTNATNRACFRTETSVAGVGSPAADWDALSIGSEWEETQPDANPGQYLVKASGEYNTSAGLDGWYDSKAATKCTGTCAGQPYVIKVIYQNAVKCCTANLTPVSCCSNVDAGTCSNVSGGVRIVGVKIGSD